MQAFVVLYLDSQVVLLRTEEKKSQHYKFSSEGMLTL